MAIPKFSTLLHPVGLRWKFFLRVVLPPLIPFMILGYFGYQQLSGLINNVVYGQLERSASDTATRVDREFSIRQSVLVQTGKDIMNVYHQYLDSTATLNQQRKDCSQAALVSQDNALTSPSCRPFLSSLITIPNGTKSHNYMDDYTSALNASVASQTAAAKKTADTEMTQKLEAFRAAFPETGPMIVSVHDKGTVAHLDSTTDPIPAPFANGIGLIQSSLSTADTPNGHTLLMAAYYLDDQHDAIAAGYDVASPDFLGSIQDSGPHIDAKNDQIWIANERGQVIYPAIKLGDRVEVVGRLNDAITKKSNGTTTATYHWPDKSNLVMVSSAAVVPRLSWAVMTATPAAAIAAKLQTTQRIALLAIIGTILVSALVGFLFVTSATNAIKRLTAGALVFAGRNFDQKINVKTGDELETLSHSLNDMAAQIQSAEKALDEKNKEFINIATHELKAPMTAIIGYLSMVVEEGEKLDRDTLEMITQAYHSTERLRDLVTELLDIARLEAGKAQFEIEPLDLKAEATLIVNNLKISAKEKAISIVFEPPVSLPAVLADKTKLGIIVTNFISNAIKYNREKGSVTIGLKQDGDFVVTSVADTGLGIPKDQQAQMFQKFFRVSSRSRSGIPGTGLGLHITKQFIEGMGGKVWFESEEDKGTTFFFSLPVAK